MARSKFIIPNNRREQVLFCLMAVLVPLFIVWEFGVILPSYHQQLSKIVIVHTVLAAFITMNIVGNVLLIIRTDASGRLSYLPSVQRQDWRYCYDCKVCAPPRSYHCLDCKECILKRNHHCMFTGCCIGYHNHRYYLVAVGYMFIGAIYAVSYQWEYCLIYMGGGFVLPTVLAFCAPHFALLLGYISAYGFVVSTINIVGLVISLCTGYLFLNQLKQVYRGQTAFEIAHKVNAYDFGWKRNFQDVLGTRWLSVWFLPIVSSNLPGDGTRFGVEDEVKAL